MALLDYWIAVQITCPCHRKQNKLLYSTNNNAESDNIKDESNILNYLGVVANQQTILLYKTDAILLAQRFCFYQVGSFDDKQECASSN